MHGRYGVRAKVWRYPGAAAWHFATLPKKTSMQIRVAHGASRSAWGSIRVIARVGRTEWKTSLFPDSRRGSYLLPIKAQVRRREGIDAGKVMRIVLVVGEGPPPG